MTAYRIVVQMAYNLADRMRGDAQLGGGSKHATLRGQATVGRNVGVSLVVGVQRIEAVAERVEDGLNGLESIERFLTLVWGT